MMQATWKQSAAALAIVATFAFGGSAIAHGVTKPQHGGIVQMSGETLFELLVEPAGVALFVVDEDEDVAASGMSAKLVVRRKDVREDVTMKPAAGNRFDAKGLKLTPGTKVSVQLTNNATQAKTSAEFTVK